MGSVQLPHRFSIKQTFAVDQVKKTFVPVDEIVKEVYCIEWKIIFKNNGEVIQFELTFYPRCWYNETFHGVNVEWESVLLKNNGTYEYDKRTGARYNSYEKKISILKLIRLDCIGNYIINGKVSVEIHVKLIGVQGITLKMRNFENPVESFSDAILTLSDENLRRQLGPVESEDQMKFHVNKALLAYHSTYFKSLFTEQLGGNCFDVGRKVRPEDLQLFLEVLHGEPVINDLNVSAVLKQAKMYDTPVVFRQCEHYLLKTSKLELKRKFDLAIEYDFENLKNDCIENMRTPEDVQNAMPYIIERMDHFLITSLLKKAASFKSNSK